ncbi:hypothetical protein D3C87_1567670 [compost metagenome]
MFSELANRGSILAFGNKHDVTRVGISDKRQVVVTAPVGRFINGGSSHAGQIEFGHREVDIALADSVHAMPRLTHRSGYSRKRHLLRKRHHHGFKQQREARELASPVRLDQRHAAVGKLHAWRADFQIAVVLEEVQVPIAFGHRVVNRVPTGDLRVGKAAAGDKVNLDRQRLGLRVEVDFPDEPRIAYAKGCLKQFAMHRSCCSLPETRHDTTHLKFKRGQQVLSMAEC